MAIQPIDLQTLFTQMDKVAKSQAFLREGQQMQDTIQQVESQRKLEENIQSVNETQDMGEEADKIKDDKRRGAHEQGKGFKGKKAESEELPAEEEKRDLIKDPALGWYVDISG